VKSFQQLIQDLPKSKPFYLLFSEDNFWLKVHSKKIIESLKLSKNCVIQKLYLDSANDIPNLQAVAHQQDLFSEQKLYILKSTWVPSSAQDSKKLLAFFESLQTITKDYFIVEMPRLSKTIQNQSWFKYLDETISVVAIWPLSDLEKKKWLRSKIEEDNLKLTSDAIDLLLEQTAFDLSLAIQRLAVLKLIKPNESIDCLDIFSLNQDPTASSVQDWVESFWMNASYHKLLTQLDLLFMQDDPAHLLLWNLQRDVSILIKINMASKSQAAQTQDSNTIFSAYKIPKFRQNFYLQAQKKWKQGKLANIQEQLKIIDLKLKGNKSQSPIKLSSKAWFYGLILPL
jgi:DNA polymerase III delta subunit